MEWLRWGNPNAFYLFFVVGAMIAAYIFFERISQTKLEKAFGNKVAAYLAQSVSLARRRVQFGLQVLALVLLVLALARPQAGESQQEIKSEGIELLVIADVSESMLAEDVRPSRLAQMKIELSKLLELMPGNKIGIIAFAGSSSLLSPLTTDPNALRMYIDSLDADSVSSQGTNFETALSYAKEAFEKGGVTQDDVARTTRAILVVSDGEDQEKGALEAAKILVKEGIRIYTMAYGTEKGGAIPDRDHYGNMTGYKKDSSGQTVLTQVHGDFLKELAQAGEGNFYFAYFDGDHLRRFVNDLGQLEKTQFQSSMLTQYEEKFTWPLLLGLVVLFLSLLISDRKLEESQWMGKYETQS
jgi:Ca-activated chloride channel family protein